MTSPPAIFDRALLVRRRDRIANAAHTVDFLLARSADDLLDRLALTRRQFGTVLNLGAHTGLLSRCLAGAPGVETIVSADTSGSMLALGTGLRVQADEEALPFRDAAFDLVVSALTLQHVNDLPGTLLQIRRALKPDGLFLGALMGGETLVELRTAFLIAEEEIEGGVSPRVAPFADVRDLGGLLQRAGFALPVTDADLVTVTYATPLHLMRELKAMGCSNTMLNRSRKPLRRDTLVRACEIYAERYGTPDGRISATFEILTLTGWTPHPSQQQPLRPGSATTRLADALRTREHKT